MGEYANQHVSNFTSGRWGMPLPKQREYPKTTRAAIAGARFKVVEVVGGATNRMPGTKLVVTENGETSYWVWASSGVTGISQAVCKTIEADLSLDQALAKLGRKPYQPKPTDV